MESELERAFIDSMAEKTVAADRIDPELYERFNVKRGLRNADGTGVLVGLTEIGDVHGYIIDEGEKIAVPGKLFYRGIDVEDMVKSFQAEGRFGFEETAYLILFGNLPSKPELDTFTKILGENRELPDNFTEDMIFKAPSQNIMNKLARATLASYSYDENPEDNSIRNVLRQSIELIARFPTMAAYAFQTKRHYYDKESLYIHSPCANLQTAENLLYMIRPDKAYSKLEAELLDLSLVLHMEHGGGNNSTFAIHVVSSSDTDTYSSIAAAIGSLKGSKHGGANIKVIQMIDDMKANVKDWADEEEVKAYLLRILAKDAFDKSGLIYGMGHAVYTISDPRAVVLREKAKELAAVKGISDEFNLYSLVERLAPQVLKMKSDKQIAPNVDFYSGFVYRMLNIPPELFTPLFAISRVVGWCAHRMEEIVSGDRIIRPAYKHVMSRRTFVPMGDR
jgi:citrate synthase